MLTIYCDVVNAIQSNLQFSETFYIDTTLTDAAIRLPMRRVRELGLPLQCLRRHQPLAIEEESEGPLTPHLPIYERSRPPHLALHHVKKHQRVTGLFGPVYVRLLDNKSNALLIICYAASEMDDQAKREYVR